MAQGVGLEFKPEYCKKKERKKERKKENPVKFKNIKVKMKI
jgi:hypothetical protein